jgi:hypothetical protein
MRQIQIEDLGRIRFVAVPQGDAPLEVREQWVGIEVPCLFSHDGVPPNPGDTMRDAATGLEIPDYPGYMVLQWQAIEALEQNSPEAAEFWKELGFPQSDFAMFLFNHNSAEVVKSVRTRQEFWQSFNDA